MLKEINGVQFRELLDHGLRHLRLYRDTVNDLNVFPVPDGDTGTNMILTLENGVSAMRSGGAELGELARAFVTAVIFGARGNSGVILSQFLKGMAECFYDVDTVDAKRLAASFEAGVASAYKAVAEPVEGTMLTVLRESADAVKEACDSGQIDTIDDAVTAFLKTAYVSLKNTPELLPVLKSAGVIDSGGAGVVYFFEGIEKLLKGEPIESVSEPQTQTHFIDYSKFTAKSEFPLGYCTELLIQLLDGRTAFEHVDFRGRISELGDSVVTSCADGKVKVHIHTQTPERVMEFCHTFGEFLAVKIENMSVQHSESSRLYFSPQRNDSAFGVVAVSHDDVMKERFIAMGADVVIDASDGYNPSAKDFTEAFAETGCRDIFVFPNCKNIILAAEQASGLFEGGRVFVLPSKSDAECYSALSMLDFDSDDTAAITKQVTENLEGVYTVTITKAVKDAVFDSRTIKRGDHIALKGSDLLAIGRDVYDAAREVCSCVFGERDCSVVTAFIGAQYGEPEGEKLKEIIGEISEYIDVDVINTNATSYEMLLSFE